MKDIIILLGGIVGIIMGICFAFSKDMPNVMRFIMSIVAICSGLVLIMAV